MPLSTYTLLLDFNNVAVAAVMAHALTDLKANETWTGGIYGTLNSVAALLGRDDMNIAGVYAARDCGIPPKRKQLIPEYKAERANKRELLTEEQKKKAYSQLDTTRELLETLGVMFLMYKDREADDVVAAAVEVVRQQGGKPLVMSGDRDLLQTVSRGADVWDYHGKRLVTKDNFKEITGVAPDDYLAYRVLVGDPSDGIKGAAGCGPKRAVELIDAMHAAGLGDCPPNEKLLDLSSVVNAVEVKKKWHEALLADMPRLLNECGGIDLYKSFGGTTGLAKKMTEPPQKPEPLKFLRMCRFLNFNSVLTDPNRFVRPFVDAYKARLTQCRAA